MNTNTTQAGERTQLPSFESDIQDDLRLALERIRAGNSGLATLAVEAAVKKISSVEDLLHDAYVEGMRDADYTDDKINRLREIRGEISEKQIREIMDASWKQSETYAKIPGERPR